MRGSGSAPAATARRSDQPPAQTIAWRASVRPASARAARARPAAPAPETSQPVRDLAARLEQVLGVGARDGGGSRRSRSPGSAARRPRACGSISRDPGRVEPAQPRHAVRVPAPLELVEAGSSDSVDGDDQLAAALVGDPAPLAVLVQLARALARTARAFSEPGS